MKPFGSGAHCFFCKRYINKSKRSKLILKRRQGVTTIRFHSRCFRTRILRHQTKDLEKLLK